MKKFTSLLIGISFALAGAAMAQQPDQQPTPKNKKQGTPKNHAAGATPGASAPNPEGTTGKQHHGTKNERTVSKAETTPKPEGTVGVGTNVTGEPVATATPGGKHGEKGKNAHGANAKTSPGATPATAASATAAPTFSPNDRHANNNAAGGEKKKVDAQQVQQIKAQHKDFHAQPKPDKAPAVTFNQNYRIEGSDHWQGPQYEVFRSYHPERHDHGWYRSHYNRVELIGGGYYYWNNGYWYPAWGYSPSAEYYAYDGPIYVGHRAEPPDQVIADVQAELQEMGYYQGEVDGLLGPMTREALTAYQADQGLTPTAAIDEPTLDSLGMG
jgi:hypothetical protein